MCQNEPTERPGEKSDRSANKRANGRGSPSGIQHSRAGNHDSLASPLVSDGADDVIDALFALDGLDQEIKTLLAPELSRLHGLANYDEAELNWNRFTLLNNGEILEAHFSPRESIWQGNLRKEGGLRDGRTALQPETRKKIRDVTKRTAYGLATRSGPERGGFNQKLLAQQQAQRREIVEKEEDSGGWLSRLLK